MNLRVPPEVRRGVRDATPVALGLVPFGLVSGVAAVEAGLSFAQAMGLSVLVYAGTSQLAAIDLLGRNAELAVVVLTAVVINLRMTMYSASIAPYFRSFSARWKALCSYVLTDQAYALAIARYAEEQLDPAARRRYFLSAGFFIWFVWQVCTVAGVLLGTGVPASWGLEFAVPLVFLGLLVPVVSNAPAVSAAVVGGSVAVVGEALAVPFNLGLMAGAVAGVLAGVATEELTGEVPEAGPEEVEG
ncbi:AzlC family ABC transporter permease [Halopelagius longus]|uniref:4-azaleucine resistance probable transporter AzlC n=1 Tax=Halopelagius longus TaxID=1236180 RepID=A0A1H0Y2G9_9EURY|nr:AzlC family ABC transporter permease [Halopelagius longus]RDI72239.1 branched-chain amino acid ABC transporter permease [Halopelagius longus]SDQ09285.1 4-azaleucine resistance probable transporter AzlC [Halopelagius longus]